MEVERTGGPLSYDLTVPDRDPSAQRGIIIGLLTVAAAWLMAVVGGWFVLGVLRNERVVNVGFPLLLVAAVLAATAWGARRSTARARRNALLVMFGASAIAALLAHNTLANVKPAVPQLQRALDAVELPGGFEVRAEETFGDRLCRRGCPRVERLYAFPAGDEDPVRTMVLAMFDQGWDPATDAPRELQTSARQGSIRVHLAEKDGVVEVTATRQ
jgi:hypothetical protein